jgi:hypothetical protein
LRPMVAPYAGRAGTTPKSLKKTPAARAMRGKRSCCGAPGSH